VARLLGVLVLVIGISMVFSLLWSTFYGEKDAQRAILISMAICLAVGIALGLTGRGVSEESLLRKEGLAVVALGWIVVPLLGALPFLLSGTCPSPVDAIFESISGFTTTGSSVLTDIESVPKGILFWRDFTHWLGGIGIIVVFIALLPQMGIGARHMFRSEIPGAVKDGVSPRIKDTAINLLGIYTALTVLETALLYLEGMSLFDALCHTFGTVATGGFSTRNASIAAYDSLAIEITIIVFMILAGTNFSLYFLLMRRRVGKVIRDAEWRVYLFIMLAATLLIAGDLLVTRTVDDAGEALRGALFQSAAVQTTTGYATRDFNAWPPLSKLVLVALMFIGGSSGSTGGGMKVVRILVLAKHAYFAVYHWFRPQAVVAIKVGNMKIKNEILQAILGFFVLFVGIFVICSLIMTMLGLDLITATTSVVATLGNIGPGLGAVGATENFSAIPAVGKIVLAFCMLLGRLEIFTVMVLFVPAVWRR